MALPKASVILCCDTPWHRFAQRKQTKTDEERLMKPGAKTPATLHLGVWHRGWTAGSETALGFIYCFMRKRETGQPKKYTKKETCKLKTCRKLPESVSPFDKTPCKKPAKQQQNESRRLAFNRCTLWTKSWEIFGK